VTHAPHPTDHLDRSVLADYLSRTRWFGGKGRPFSVTGVRVLGEVPGREADSPHVLVHLVEVGYDDHAAGQPGDTELYQVPLALYEHPQGRLDHAFIGWWEDPVLGWVHAYDAVHDREAMACWLRSFETAAAGGVDAGSDLAFHRVPGHDLDTTAHSSLFSGEQSNSSVAFGEDALMKVFRKVTPGVNPDIQIHQVLTEAGSEHVAALYGWLDVVAGTDGDETTDQAVMQLAMLQQFLRTATDGWDLALASVRGLLADPEVHATDSGGDFAPEATRLGEAVAEIHAQLAEHFPTEVRGPEAAAALAAAMGERLDRAVAAVPDLAAHADRLRAVFGRVAELDRLEVQRIHGDLHLGQTLRTAKGWKIVDFEGEPAKPLSERLLPDSRWRDVAGMLRSFDYAPRSVEQSQPSAERDSALAEQLRQRADEWAHRNRNHFLVAYGGDLSAEQRVLLDAYVADKAVYETVYEARNRPAWISIPLDAIARIGA
jgi:maltokinase